MGLISSNEPNQTFEILVSCAPVLFSASTLCLLRLETFRRRRHKSQASVAWCVQPNMAGVESPRTPPELGGGVVAPQTPPSMKRDAEVAELEDQRSTPAQLQKLWE